MDDTQRKHAIQDFKDNPYTKVLLASIRVGGVGLNLCAANIVVILEPWWNPAVEDQAIDRINRIGQKVGSKERHEGIQIRHKKHNRRADLRDQRKQAETVRFNHRGLQRQ